ncbi:hypothetical protein QR685DRAFT_430127, partial [Neurospora intermedia]
IIRLAPNKAFSSNWLDLSAKTVICIEIALVDSDYSTIAPGPSRVFSNYLKL